MVNVNISPFEAIGGEDTLEALVEAFYSQVSRHPVLIPLFPEDFTEIKDKQRRFLTQFLGGPPLYTEVYGHPRMRARHLRFPIGKEETEAWLSCMNTAMDQIKLESPWREAIMKRLTMTAYHMKNIHDEIE